MDNIQKDRNTEEQILDAAKKVFVNKGFDGARMQEIADEAEINKSLLHYYYRSKNKLFEAVFNDAFKDFIPKIGKVFTSDKSLKQKIKFIVENYIDMLIKNPHLPIFVLHELHRNPDIIIHILKNYGVNPDMIIKQIEKGIKDKSIRNIEPRHLIVNILSMCIFPFAAKPMLEGFLFKKNKKAYEKFISERKEQVTKFIINSITIT